MSDGGIHEMCCFFQCPYTQFKIISALMCVSAFSSVSTFAVSSLLMLIIMDSLFKMCVIVKSVLFRGT